MVSSWLKERTFSVRVCGASAVQIVGQTNSHMLKTANPILHNLANSRNLYWPQAVNIIHKQSLDNSRAPKNPIGHIQRLSILLRASWTERAFSPVAMVTAAMQPSQCIESIESTYLKWRKVIEESEMSPLEGNVQDTSAQVKSSCREEISQLTAGRFLRGRST